jgi:hypothetical protein
VAGCHRLARRGFVMKIVRRQSVLPCVVLLFLTTQAVAKRMPPKPVAPVVFDGIRYTAEGDGRDQYVVGADASSGKVLWRVKVFHNHIKFWMEACVQSIFIKDLKLADNSLVVRDELSRCYSVDLTKRRVRKCDCGSVFAR